MSALSTPTAASSSSSSLLVLHQVNDLFQAEIKRLRKRLSLLKAPLRQKADDEQDGGSNNTNKKNMTSADDDEEIATSRRAIKTLTNMVKRIAELLDEKSSGGSRHDAAETASVDDSSTTGQTKAQYASPSTIATAPTTASATSSSSTVSGAVPLLLVPDINAVITTATGSGNLLSNNSRESSKSSSSRNKQQQHFSNSTQAFAQHQQQEEEQRSGDSIRYVRTDRQAEAALDLLACLAKQYAKDASKKNDDGNAGEEDENPIAHRVPLGLDIEWRPNFKANAAPNPPAVLQVAVYSRFNGKQPQQASEQASPSSPVHSHAPITAFVFSLRELSPNTISAIGYSLLSTQEFLLCGVGIMEDLLMLESAYPLAFRDVVRVAVVTPEVGRQRTTNNQLKVIDAGVVAKNLLQMEKSNLFYLAGVFAGVEHTWKSKSVQISNWESRPLSPKQVQYAADDAAASLLVLGSLLEKTTYHGVVAMIEATHEDNGGRVLCKK